MMNSVIVWAFLSHFPVELGGYVALRGALQPIVQIDGVI